MDVQTTTISFNDIYTSYYRKAFLFAKSYVHDDLAAEDIASDSLIKLWERMKEEEIAYVQPLLLTILKNKSLDHLKHDEIKRNVFDNLTDWYHQELDMRISNLEACDPDEIFSDEVTRIVQETLHSLSEQTRRIFEMSRFEDKSNKEIAEIMGISVKGIDYHISKALKELRVTLKDYLPLFYFFFYFH
nr:RNA polymerase sigma-70 factor [uncultured Bacteroides sp.]